MECTADQHLQTLFCRLLSCHSFPLNLCQALLHPGCRIWHFILLNLIPLFLGHCSNLSRALCKMLLSERIKSSSHLVSSAKPASDALNFCIQAVGKYMEQDRPQNSTLRNTPDDQSPDSCSPSLYNPLSSTLQPVLHPAHHEPSHPTAGQPMWKNAVRESFKSHTKIQ